MASDVQFTEDMTHEDVQDLVDEIIERSDAETLAADRDETTGTIDAEEPSGDETAQEDSAEDSIDESEGEEKTGETEDDRAWLDDDLKAETAAYGIDETDLADFSSREEVERALRFIDKTALEAGRKAVDGEDDETQDRDEKGRFQTKETPESEAKEGGFEITLDTELYDEELVDQLTGMRDHYESRIAALEAQFAQANEEAEEREFDVLVDNLGHADLFGKSGSESKKELQRRQDLFVAAKAQRIGLEQMGRPADLDETFLGRVARMVFADEIGKKDLKNRTRRLSRQSNGRMGGSAVKAHDSAEPLMDEMRRLYKELDEASA